MFLQLLFAFESFVTEFTIKRRIIQVFMFSLFVYLQSIFRFGNKFTFFTFKSFLFNLQIISDIFFSFILFYITFLLFILLWWGGSGYDRVWPMIC